MSTLYKPKIIFVFGGPGSGKGLQCEKMAESYGLLPLSPGELLRTEFHTDTERSRLVRDILERGEQLPVGALLELLREAMGTAPDHVKGFLLDGFPRNIQQTVEFEAKIGEPSLVLLLECSPDTMCRRLQQRPQSGFQSEDSRDAVRKRVQSFFRECEPIAAHYERKRLLYKIDAEGPPDEVFQQACQLLDSC
ncbi:hypothetical protein AAFF_G00000030 [Aldrovandia affinis]|uniref:Adenylate kinase n=1 Tax=Aldrovandia affinis TaxID=143900 RepID=A0AAD7TCK7_9TELE|nr:hypothetical protein AAFF_G00000030 [Aldrovandia affinis]